MKQLVHLALIVALTGCTSSSPWPPLEDRVSPPPTEPPPPTDPRPVVPDAADVVQADVPPPAISGGSLLITADGAFAVAGDPDLDRIYVVDLATNTLTRTFELAEDSEPGRLIEDADGVVHAVLRRGGSIVDFLPSGVEPLRERSICAAPRGIAHRVADDTLVVACAEGRLVFLPAAGGAPTSEIALADDLRDVVVTPDGDMLVSRFRTPEIFLVSGVDGEVLRTITLPRIEEFARREIRPGEDRLYAEPGVLWRMVSAPGGALVLHQRATNGVVETDPDAGGYGGFDCFQPAVVHTTASFVTTDGEVTRSPPLVGVALGVDIALSPDASDVTVAAPALANPRADASPRMDIGEFTDVMAYSSALLDTSMAIEGPIDPDTCIRPHITTDIPGRGGAVAVAYRPDGGVVAFARAPSRLVVITAVTGTSVVVDLAEEETFDTGHEIFHSATAGGLSCASCHPEGADDGRVWFFRGLGERRTQTLSGGLLGSEPFHWAGDMDDFATLAHTVFEGRMSGNLLADNELTVFAEWIDTLEPPVRPAVDAAAAERGRVLFESTETACATCHGGPLLTSSLTVDVGTGEPLQVPSLIGLAHRAPYMHDGCATDLRTRFTDAACGGGEMHGHTAHLTEAEVSDLVTHLMTL